jgi:hypothetical protein
MFLRRNIENKKENETNICSLEGTLRIMYITSIGKKTLDASKVVCQNWRISSHVS